MAMRGHSSRWFQAGRCSARRMMDLIVGGDEESPQVVLVHNANMAWKSKATAAELSGNAALDVRCQTVGEPATLQEVPHPGTAGAPVVARCSEHRDTVWRRQKLSQKVRCPVS